MSAEDTRALREQIEQLQSRLKKAEARISTAEQRANDATELTEQNNKALSREVKNLALSVGETLNIVRDIKKPTTVPLTAPPKAQAQSNKDPRTLNERIAELELKIDLDKRALKIKEAHDKEGERLNLEAARLANTLWLKDNESGPPDYDHPEGKEIKYYSDETPSQRVRREAAEADAIERARQRALKRDDLPFTVLAWLLITGLIWYILKMVRLAYLSTL